MEAELPMFKKKESWWLGRPGTTQGQVDALPLSSLPTWGLQADSEGSFPTSPVSSLTRDGLVFVFFPDQVRQISLKGPQSPC